MVGKINDCTHPVPYVYASLLANGLKFRSATSSILHNFIFRIFQLTIAKNEMFISEIIIFLFQQKMKN